MIKGGTKTQMDYYYYVVQPNGEINTLKEPQQFKELEFYYNHIGCSYIEVLPLPSITLDGKLTSVCAVLDEEGMLNGSGRNKFLSKLSDFPIYGTAVIATTATVPDSEGERDLAGFPIDVLDTIKSWNDKD